MEVKKRYILYSIILAIVLALLILVALILTILTGLLGGYAIYWDETSESSLAGSTLVYFHSMFGFAVMGVYLIFVSLFGYIVILLKWKDGFIWLIFLCSIIIVGEVGMAVYIYLERNSLVNLLPFIWNFLDDRLRSVLQNQLGCCYFGNVTFGNITFVPAFTNTSDACRSGLTNETLRALCNDKLMEVLTTTVYVAIAFMVALILIQLAVATLSMLLVQVAHAYRRYKKMEANEKAAKTSNSRIPRGQQAKSSDHNPIMQTSH